MKRFAALVLAVVTLASTPAVFAQKARSAKQSVPSFGNVEGITAKQLRDYLTFIASDELEGRDTPSRGLDIAAMYIAQHLSSWGIKPAGGDGTYFQKVPLRIGKVLSDRTMVEFGGRSFHYGKDFLSAAIRGTVTDAPLVFAGNGWVIKSKNIDAFSGVDVKDKVVVVTGGLPKGITFQDLKGPQGGDWMSAAFYAQSNGAKAVITFPNFAGLANWEGTKYNQAEKGLVEFGKPQNTYTIPNLFAAPQMIAALFSGEKVSSTTLFNRSITGEPSEAFDLAASKRVSLTVGVDTHDIHTQNVVGILEGSDPVLKNEYVAIGAHYDHVGTNPYAPGADKIWNGADDDGSGTVSVLSMAEAFAKGAVRPKRSILFIWHAGEEKGLWGSEYFSDNPTVPISSIIAELNIDMIGRYQNPGDENHPRNKNLPKPGEVFLIGSKLMSTELGEISEATNKAFLNLSFNYKYDDPNDPEQYFYRSDHYNYARKGVPIIFYMDGDHADYHQPSDSIEKINFEQMEKVARTIMATGWALANTPSRPKVDKPLQTPSAGN